MAQQRAEHIERCVRSAKQCHAGGESILAVAAMEQRRNAAGNRGQQTRRGVRMAGEQPQQLGFVPAVRPDLAIQQTRQGGAEGRRVSGHGERDEVIPAVGEAMEIVAGR